MKEKSMRDVTESLLWALSSESAAQAIIPFRWATLREGELAFAQAMATHSANRSGR